MALPHASGFFAHRARTCTRCGWSGVPGRARLRSVATWGTVAVLVALGVAYELEWVVLDLTAAIVVVVVANLAFVWVGRLNARPDACGGCHAVDPQVEG